MSLSYVGLAVSRPVSHLGSLLAAVRQVTKSGKVGYECSFSLGSKVFSAFDYSRKRAKQRAAISGVEGTTRS